jgi:hypothetical protein
MTNKKYVSFSSAQVIDLDPTLRGHFDTTGVALFVTSNLFFTRCTGVELIVSKLSHAQRANAYVVDAVMLRRPLQM